MGHIGEWQIQTKSRQRETRRENEAENQKLNPVIHNKHRIDCASKKNLILHFAIVSAYFIGIAEKVSTLPLSG